MQTDTGTGIGTVSARLHKQLRKGENRTFNRTPSGQTSGLKLKGEGAFAETGGFLTSITLELNLNKALIVRGKKSVSYALKPVLQVVTAELEPLPENTAGAVVLPDYESFMKLGDIFFLSIPAGAVAEETILTVEEIKNYIEVLDPLTQQIIVLPDLASTFKLKPEGLVFATPLQLTLQYNIAALRDKFTEQDLTIRHDGHKVETTLDTYAQVVSGEINHFSSVTISTYSGKCTEEKVGDFKNGSPIKYFDCEKTDKYPRMHVAVADRSALAYTHQLKIIAHESDDQDGTFTTEQVKDLVNNYSEFSNQYSSPNPIVAINGTTFSCKDSLGNINNMLNSCYYNREEGFYPSYTVVTDGVLTRLKEGVALTLDGKIEDNKIPINYIAKAKFRKEFKESFNFGKSIADDSITDQYKAGSLEGASKIESDKAFISPMYWTMGSHQGSRKNNTCPITDGTGNLVTDDPLSQIGYSNEELIFLVSQQGKPFKDFEDACEAMKIFGASYAALMDGDDSAQLVIDGNLKNFSESSDARHVVSAVGLVCNTPEEDFTDSDGKHTHIIHPTKYRCSNNLCWAPSWKPDMGLAEGDLNCWDADKWFEIKDGEICGDKVERDRSICAEVYAGDDDSDDEDPICESSEGTTQGETCTAQDKEKDPGEDIPSGQPDMDVQTSTLGNGQHTERHRRLTADPGESIYGFVKIRNKGTGNADDVNLSFYLDAGDIDFKREDKDFIAAHYVGKFFVGQEIRYVVGFHAPEKPGKYTFYGCIDNSGDSRYENNCPIMKNEDEYARLTVEEPPPEPSDLTAHSLRLNSSETTIPGGRLFGLTLTVANVGDGDAESNFQIRHEINGPSTSYTWKTLAESRFSTVLLYAGSSEEHRTVGQLAAAPGQEGIYRIRSCVDSNGAISESNEGNNCTEELEIEVLPSLDPTLKPVYRFYSEANLAHFFTIFESEKDTVINTYPTEVWRYERIGFCAHTSQVDDSLPVYRFYSDSNTAHFFTIFETEKNNIISTYPEDIWRYERIGWYAYNYPKAGTIPVYRFYSESNRAHFYTVFESEKQYIEEHYPDDVWRYERIGWWVYPCP